MKGKYIVIGLIFLLVSFNVTGSFIRNFEKMNDSTINDDGNILYVGGNGPNNYTKIQDAINDSVDGDTVFVYNGTYYEHNITIDKSINLIGENRETTIIYGINTTNILIVDSDCFYISGFTIKNGENAISLISGNISISHNNISSNFLGITNIFVTNDTLEGVVNINNNIFWNNSFLGIGILGGYDFNLNISENLFINNNVGCLVGTVFNCIISYNIFENNTAEALCATISVNCTIKNNHIINNQIGFRSMLLYNSNIQFNNICNNNYSFHINGGGNKIIQNNFINNNFTGVFDRYVFFEFLAKFQFFIWFNFYYDIGYQRVLSKNKWDENYWNEPRTLPYLIRGNLYLFLPFRTPLPLFNIDWHPASEPYDI